MSKNYDDYVSKSSYRFEWSVKATDLVTLQIRHNKKLKIIERFFWPYFPVFIFPTSGDFFGNI